MARDVGVWAVGDGLFEFVAQGHSTHQSNCVNFAQLGVLRGEGAVNNAHSGTDSTSPKPDRNRLTEGDFRVARVGGFLVHDVTGVTPLFLGVGGGRLLHSIRGERYCLERHVENSVLGRAGSYIVFVPNNIHFLSTQIDMESGNENA